MSSAGVNCLYAEVGKTGTGGAAFKTFGETGVEKWWDLTDLTVILP